jgi:hypothetical protein
MFRFVLFVACGLNHRQNSFVTSGKRANDCKVVTTISQNPKENKNVKHQKSRSCEERSNHHFKNFTNVHDKEVHHVIQIAKTISNNTITGNSAVYGGGIFCDA